jgi:hypothetical protein
MSFLLREHVQPESEITSSSPQPQLSHHLPFGNDSQFGMEAMAHG